jgi:hypothetical protein
MEVELNGRKLRVYECGKIESFYKNLYWIELNYNPDKYGYCSVKINKKMYRKHRIIGMVYLGLDITNLKTLIDHIDHNKLNNHVSNLRVVTNQQNSFNRSNVKGYSWDKQKNKYKASIKIDGKTKHLGHYATEDEAHNAYLVAKVKYHIIE